MNNRQRSDWIALLILFFYSCFEGAWLTQYKIPRLFLSTHCRPICRLLLTSNRPVEQWKMLPPVVVVLVDNISKINQRLNSRIKDRKMHMPPIHHNKAQLVVWEGRRIPMRRVEQIIWQANEFLATAFRTQFIWCFFTHFFSWNISKLATTPFNPFDDKMSDVRENEREKTRCKSIDYTLIDIGVSRHRTEKGSLRTDLPPIYIRRCTSVILEIETTKQLNENIHEQCPIRAHRRTMQIRPI